MATHHIRNECSIATAEAETSNDVLKFYDDYADSWDDRFGSAASTADFHRMRLGSFLKVARPTASDQAVELGVGTGPYLQAIAPRVKSLVAIDGSAGMLRVLRTKVERLPNLVVEQHDLERPMPPRASAADLVYAFGVFEHIIDTAVFLENCRQLLRPGGRLVLVGTNGQSPWYGPLRRIWRGGAHCRTDRYHRHEALNALLREHGFEVGASDFWGFYPAGVSRPVQRVLQTLGVLATALGMARYAGGLTAEYRRVS